MISQTTIRAILDEAERQDVKWGDQSGLADGVSDSWAYTAHQARCACQESARIGCCTWREILLEEVYEACAEEDAAKLAEELIQVAAVAAQWVEALRRRGRRI